jgi:hypothetical protein
VTLDIDYSKRTNDAAVYQAKEAGRDQVTVAALGQPLRALSSSRSPGELGANPCSRAT